MHSQISTALTAILSLGAVVTAIPSAANKRADEKPGCSKASFGDFKWQITNFVYNASYIYSTPAHQNSMGTVKFNLFNPAFAADGGASSEALCSASSQTENDFFYGDIPYSCSSNTREKRKSSFDYNHISGLLRLNESWVCEDIDPMYPTIFSAYGVINVTLDCSNTSYVNKNWTIGDIYSDLEITCKSANLWLKPDEISAIA